MSITDFAGRVVAKAADNMLLTAVGSVANKITNRRSVGGLLKDSKADNLLVIRRIRKTFSKPYFEVSVEGQYDDFIIKEETSKKLFSICSVDGEKLAMVERYKGKRHRFNYRFLYNNSVIGEIIPRLKEKNTYDIDYMESVLTSDFMGKKFTVSDSKKKKVMKITYTSENNGTYVVEYKDADQSLNAMLYFVVVNCIREYDTKK